MNKSAKTYLGILLVVFILILSVGIYFVVADEPPPQDDWIIWSTTSSTQTFKNIQTNEMKIVMYSGEQFMDLQDKRRPNFVLPNASYFPITNFSSNDSTYKDFIYKLGYYDKFGREEKMIDGIIENSPDNQYTSYKAYFRNNSNTAGAVRFEKSGYFFSYDLSGGKMQWRAKPGQPAVTDTLGGGAPSNSQDSYAKITQTNEVMYPGAFYNTNVTYEMKKDMLKENFVLYGLPSYKDYLYLEYTGNIKFNKSLDICANDICYTPSGTQDDFETSGRIDFKDSNGTTIFYLAAPIITDSAGNQIEGIYSVHGSNAQMNFWLRINKTFLETAVYPVTIDPTVQYNYNTTFENVNMWAYDTGGTGCTTTPPTTITNACIDTDITTDSDLDSSDDNRESEQGTEVTDEGIFLFKAKINENVGNITLMNWTWEGNDNGGVGTLTLAIWNTTKNGYSTVGTTTSDTDVIISSSFTNATPFINSSGFSHLIAYYSTPDDFQTDFVKLEISYIPIINIISPTPSQIFTQDFPTAYLNISTTTPVDVCYWNNGSTNFTMASVNSTYFYNSTAGSQLLDGSKTISFWCNDSTTGEWAHSSNVSFDIDSVNITTCRDLTVGNRSYSLLNNVKDVGTCFVITASNITLDCNGKLINYSSGGASYVYGVYSNKNFTTIKNGIIKNGKLSSGESNYAVYLDGVSNNTINNNTIVTSTSTNGHGIRLSTSSFNNISNNNITTGIYSSTGINFYDSMYNIISNNIINTSGIYSHGFHFSSGGIIKPSNNNFSSDVIVSGGYGVNYGTTNVINNIFVNETYLTEQIFTGGQLIRKWYFSSQVNYTNGSLVNNANVTAYNISNSIQNTTQSNSSGQTPIWELIEYINNVGTKTYYTNYTINATLANWDTVPLSLNLTTNFINQQLWINDSTKPVSSAVATAPPGGASYTFNTWTNNTVKVTITGSDLASGFDNTIYPVYCFDTTNTCTPSTYIGSGVTNTSEGTYYIRYFTKDRYDNQETTLSQTIKTDFTAPSINITTPINNTNTSNTQLNVNYTINDSGSGISSCWYTKNLGVTNTSLTSSCNNITGVTWSEGINNITIYVNDTVNNVNSSSVIFRLDTTAPSVSILYPTSSNYRDIYSYNLSLNVSISDSGVGESTRWWTINNGISNTTFTGNTTVIGLTNNSNTIKVYTNDTLNNINSTSITFNLTFTPKINNINISNSTTSYSRDLTNGLVLYWNFDKNWTTIFDSSGNGYNGTPYNCSYTDSGKIGGAYSFNGSTNYIDNTNKPSYSNMTQVAWFKMNVVGTTTRKLVLRDGSGDNGMIYQGSSESNIRATAYNGADWSDISINGVQANVWYFVANTIESNGTHVNHYLYLYYPNGTIASTSHISAGTFSKSTGFRVGGSSYPFNGTIDEVRVYNRVLTLSEIQQLYSITNPTFQEYANVTINATITDEDTPQASLYYQWFVDGVEKLAGLAQNIFNWIFTGRSNIVQLNVNDTNNYYVNQTWNISTTFINPLIDYGTNTAIDYANLSQNWIYVNVTWTEANFANITFTLKNDTSTVNTTTFTTATYTINWTNLPNTNYSYYVNITDLVNNVNSTSIRHATLDTIKPNINIVSPSNNSNLSYNTVSVNYTVSDIYLSSCWYSNDTYTENTTLPSCINITSVTWTEGQHNITIWANDSAGNTNSSFVRFFVDTVYPQISYGTNTAVNYANLSQNWIYVNTTWSEINLKNITFSLYNSSWNNVTTYTTATYLINFTNLANGNYWYYVNITDIAGNSNSTNIYNITLDTINPNATLIFPANNSFNSTTSQNFTTNLSDNMGLKNATIYVYNDTGEENHTSINFAVNTLTYTFGAVMNMLEGIKKWWVQVWDWAGNTFTSGNYTMTIDTTYPQISYNLNTEVNGTYKQTGDIFINITASDTNKDTVKLEWQGVNETFDNIDGNYYWENKTGLAEGTYNFYAWINDSANNFNSTLTRTIYIDLNNPTLNIVSPTASSYNYNESININYTVSDLNLASCWWNLDLGTNNSIACGTNTTINVSEATHTIYVYANDSSGRLSSDSVEFAVNLGAPGIVLNYPSEALWINSQTIEFNYTPSDTTLDTCQLWGNWTGIWHLNQSNSTPNNYSINTFNSVINDGSYKWNIWCNDSGDLQSWGNPTSNNTFHIDSIYPQISYGTGTEINNYNTTRTWIYVNVSVTEINEGTIIFRLYNSTSLVNSTSSTSGLRSVNWTNLVDEFYYYNITINDSAGNTNTTTTYKITLDDTKPILTILIPLSQNYATNDSMSLNYSATDNIIGLDECWYYIQNSSGYTTKSSETLSDCENDTFTLPGGDIDYTLYLLGKDFNNNIQSTSIAFGIRTVSPVVVLYPSNDTHVKNGANLYFNFTATTNSDNIDNCSLYGNFNGTWLLNQTLTNPTEGANINFSSLNLSEGSYLWNVLCYDNFNHNSWALNNNTFVVDLTSPKLNITSPSNASSFSGLTTTIYFNVSDLYINNCFFTLRDSSDALHNYAENTSLTCAENGSRAISTLSYGTYNFYLYGQDYAGNENSTILTFTNTAPIAPSTGGGGAVTPKEEEYPVAMIIQGSNLTQFDELRRAIIFAEFNNYCETKVSSILSIVNYYQECELKDEDLSKIKLSLQSNGIIILSEEMINWYDLYKNNRISQFYTTRKNIELYNLLEVVVTNPMILNPSIVDSYFIAKSLLEYTILSNKPLKSCAIISDTPMMSCQIVSNTTAKIMYNLTDFSFLSKNFQGKISVTSLSEKGDTREEETRYVSITMRVLNLTRIMLIGIPIIVFIIGISLYIHKSRKLGKLRKKVAEAIKLNR